MDKVATNHHGRDPRSRWRRDDHRLVIGVGLGELVGDGFLSVCAMTRALR
jgi:hypothetical protein